MKDETKILLDRIESIARKLDRYFLVLIILIVFGITTLLQQEESITIPVLGTKINDPAIFHMIIAAAITAIFGMIGSGLLDYFMKRKLYDRLNGLSGNSEEDSLHTSLITRSQYENVYKSKEKPEISRIVIVLIMFVFLEGSNVISYFHACKVLDTNYRMGVATVYIVLIILVLLHISFVRTIFKKNPATVGSSTTQVKL